MPVYVWPTPSKVYSKPELVSLLANAWFIQDTDVDSLLESYYDDWALPYSWLSFDMDGDDKDEWIITIFPKRIVDRNGMILNCLGEFWIINEQGLVYELPFEIHLFQNLPTVLASPDMTGDGLQDLVVVTMLMGAHTPTMTFYVVSAHNGQFESVIQVNNELDRLSEPFRPAEKRRNAPCVEVSDAEYEIVDRTGDLVPDLILTGGTFGSVGAGIHRARIETWAWDGTRITLAQVQWQKSNWRIHVLFDAEFEFLQGHYESAIALYKQVVYDDELQDGDPYNEIYTAQESYDFTRQYAAFRLMLSWLSIGNVDNAGFWHDWLNTEYSTQPIAKAGETFWNHWQESGDLIRACYGDCTISFYTGYANPELSCATLCSGLK